MKTERLYAITVYLLNHGKTSANELAKYFEVSVRTIQRDIDSLCIAGIPIIATGGTTGGYEISERFKMDQTLATADEYSLLLTALRGLISATENQTAKHMLEKLTSPVHADVSHMDILHTNTSSANASHTNTAHTDASHADTSRTDRFYAGTSHTNTARVNAFNMKDSSMILDFSVLREGDPEILQFLQNAILKKRAVRFTYTNNNNETRTHCVEPIAVIYRWYAWYLLAYSRVKDDYRTYKLLRMDDLEITEESFTKEHESADTIFQKNNQTDSRQYTEVLLRCKASAIPRAMEYLKGKVVEEFPDGDVLLKTCVVENELFWFGALLSFGDEIEVIAPEKIRVRVIDAAERVISLYQKK